MKIVRLPRSASCRAALVGAMRATEVVFPVLPNEPMPERLTRALAALDQAEACGADQRNEPSPPSRHAADPVTVGLAKAAVKGSGPAGQTHWPSTGTAPPVGQLPAWL